MQIKNIFNLYKFILIGSFLINILGVIYPLFHLSSLSKDEVALLAYDGWGADILYSGILYWSLLTINLLALLGLYFYYPLARIVFIGLLIIELFLGMLLGFHVVTASMLFLENLLLILYGSTLSLIYFSKVSLKFGDLKE